LDATSRDLGIAPDHVRETAGEVTELVAVAEGLGRDREGGEGKDEGEVANRTRYEAHEC
jgi:hypothetical protein